MLIATYFKRPNAPVTIGAEVYFFKPIVPEDSESVHVCEVMDTQHIQMLLSHPEGYYILEAEAKGPSAVRPAPARAAQQQEVEEHRIGDESTASPVGTSDDGGDDVDNDEVTQQAAKLIDNSWQKVLQLVKGGDIPARVLESALQQELAKAGTDEPRQSVVKALRAQLGE